MKRELVKTKDGSHSFYVPELDEHYHSKHGSIAESKHIFINAGLKEAFQLKDSIDLLEIGMGTGLNVFLTAVELKRMGMQKRVQMTSIEAYPISEGEVKELNYADELGEESLLFEKIHNLSWNVKQKLTDNFDLLKVHAKLEDYSFHSQFDLVYFDAFAPEKQAELWEEEIFMKLYNQMRPNGILVTYCVKGLIKRRLKSIGFEIEKLAGPPGGKREMLRARKLV